MILVLFYVLIVCTVTLPPGVNPIAVDKYIYLSSMVQPNTPINYCSCYFIVLKVFPICDCHAISSLNWYFSYCF